jgi:hypothetical protein
MDDEDLQSRTSEEKNRAQRTRTIDRDDKKLFLYQASADDKTSAPSDAGRDEKVKMEGLAQRTIGSENISNQLPTHITEPPPINERDYFLQPLTNSLKKIRLATHRTEACPLQQHLQMIIIRAGVSAWIVLKKSKY